MAKQIGVYLYSAVLFDDKKNEVSLACYNMDGLWKHYAKWKKLDTKDQRLCDSI